MRRHLTVCHAGHADKSSGSCRLEVQKGLQSVFLASLGLPVQKGDMSVDPSISMTTPIAHAVALTARNKTHNAVNGRTNSQNIDQRRYYELDSKQRVKVIGLKEKKISSLRKKSRKKTKKVSRIKKSKDLLRMKLTSVRQSLQTSFTKVTLCGKELSKKIHKLRIEPARKGRFSKGTAQSGDNRHFHKKALFMQAKLKVVSDMAAAKIAPSMNVITENIATESYKESWASGTTVLRAVQVLHRTEMMLLRDNLKKASNITYR